jgi:uncharacterized membrane protein (DUF2068 family)
LTIGIFKLMKALFFFALGVGALHFLNADLGDAITQAATALKFDPDSHFMTVLLSKAGMIGDHELRMVSVGTFAYSGIALTEGVGLLMEQTWAEYLTLILGIAFLPWEGFELIRRATIWREGIIVINLVIVAYLLWFVRGRRQASSAAESASGS